MYLRHRCQLLPMLSVSILLLMHRRRHLHQ
jgi:hypothetical protein